MRNDLLISKYNGEIYRAVLTPDGRGVRAEANPPVMLSTDGGLDLVQGPSGTVYIAKYKSDKIRYLEPKKNASNDLIVKSVFPRRGSHAGGSLLRVYGENFDMYEAPTVLVGGSNCTVQAFISTKIECTLPGGPAGTVDIVVASANATDTFSAGYRYITGMPV